MNIYRYFALILLLCSPGLETLHAATTYDVAADYLDGFTAKTNPNGAWSYGWSLTAGDTLHLYTQTSGAPGSFAFWTDPPATFNGVPTVFMNIGTVPFNANTIENLPPGALAFAGGNLTLSFSEIVWTSPTSEVFDLATTFTGRQQRMNVDVEIVKKTANGLATLFSGTVMNQTSQTFAAQIAVNAGDQIIFAARGNPGTNGVTQLAAILVSTVATPEPGTFASILVGLACFAARRRAFTES